MNNVEHESRDGQHRIHVLKGKLFFTVMVNDEGLVVDLERDDGTGAVEEVMCVRWSEVAAEVVQQEAKRSEALELIWKAGDA